MDMDDDSYLDDDSYFDDWESPLIDEPATRELLLSTIAGTTTPRAAALSLSYPLTASLAYPDATKPALTTTWYIFARIVARTSPAAQTPLIALLAAFRRLPADQQPASAATTTGAATYAPPIHWPSCPHLLDELVRESVDANELRKPEYELDEDVFEDGDDMAAREEHEADIRQILVDARARYINLEAFFARLCETRFPPGIGVSVLNPAGILRKALEKREVDAVYAAGGAEGRLGAAAVWFLYAPRALGRMAMGPRDEREEMEGAENWDLETGEAAQAMGLDLSEDRLERLEFWVERLTAAHVFGVAEDEREYVAEAVEALEKWKFVEVHGHDTLDFPVFPHWTEALPRRRRR